MLMYNENMGDEKFGNGSDTCKVCDAKLTDVRVLLISIKHKDGTELADIKYYVPLCDQHRQNDCLDVNIGWDSALASIDEMRD